MSLLFCLCVFLGDSYLCSISLLLLSDSLSCVLNSVLVHVPWCKKIKVIAKIIINSSDRHCTCIICV